MNFLQDFTECVSNGLSKNMVEMIRIMAQSRLGERAMIYQIYAELLS